MLVERHAGYKQTLTEFTVDGLSKIFFRNYYGGTWGPWKQIYHSGVLGNATTSVAGLMSPTDKTKLDGITTVVGGFNNSGNFSSVAVYSRMYGKIVHVTGTFYAASASSTGVLLGTLTGLSFPNYNPYFPIWLESSIDSESGSGQIDFAGQILVKTGKSARQYNFSAIYIAP